ncbi:uroporphyrinogen-III C-methyltransferase [soil metagenome]
MSTGRIVLVGAGPGDPELLTLKAVRAIAAADVLLVDDLVDPAVLVHARADARIVEVGKRGGCKSTPQTFIERLMIAEALEGHTVVRLKGGDPHVFGRSGEEIERAREAGIPIEIVPGVTAAFAAAADTLTSLTDRRVAQGCVFVTGHEKPGVDDTGIDWPAIVATGFTIVIYMGVARASSLQRQLLDGGCTPSMPVLVVSRASQHDSTALPTRLEAMATDMNAHGIGSPAIIIVGEVARRTDARALALDHPRWNEASG